MKQITKTEWYQSAMEYFYCIQLCHLPYSVKEIESIFGLSFFQYSEEGLGVCYAVYIAIGDKMYLLKAADKDDKENGVLVEVKNLEKNPVAFLNSICKEFNVSKNSLIWVNSDL
jgi:hypothetical protein